MTGRRGLLLGAAALAAPVPARARSSRSAELLVGAAPGSPADLWARGVAPFLERRLPRLAVTVRNQPGRGGLDAVAALLATPAEAMTFGSLTSPPLLVRAIEAGEPSPLTYLQPLAALVEEPVVLVTGNGPPETLAALRALGDKGVIGTPPSGSAAHVASLRFDGRLDLPRLAFPSAAAARQAAIAGNVAAAVIGLADASAALREGKLTALGLASTRRSTLLPDVPTLRELGVDLVAATLRGFTLPPSAPDPWRATLLTAMESVTADTDLAAQCAALGQTPRFLGPEAWTRTLTRIDEDLRRRWRDDPWLPRRA